jgi:hypothetical protein
LHHGRPDRGKVPRYRRAAGYLNLSRFHQLTLHQSTLIDIYILSQLAGSSVSILISESFSPALTEGMA